ncbi:uncharacterized protein [Spinacia oleracea]|uniref:Uncharacterized protein n=1 Tax=Spinacia oleracea TaxID=3562 RepID=A0ABM3RJS1_SPIOL|nr:uncharacterized protein LOC130462412 [Spinacia oleracea]XP_056691555.1 uncharacterized protein LOC130467131 [Spinacia oleracea]XP_056693998.1 uncharacterized protein LOC130468978 [Spinacia oleracea]XP_056695850.1 uncharacterized protein LOC130470221 [Spinacia oleracea]
MNPNYSIFTNNSNPYSSFSRIKRLSASIQLAALPLTHLGDKAMFLAHMTPFYPKELTVLLRTSGKSLWEFNDQDRKALEEDPSVFDYDDIKSKMVQLKAENKQQRQLFEQME